MLNPNKRAVSPVIAIVLLLMMTVAAAGAAYFWLTSIQSGMQESSRKSIENIMEASGRRVVAQGTLCKPTYPYKGLVGYWMMDEGSGDYANDSSKYENDGMIHGANWTDGKVGQALDFNGENDYVISNKPSRTEGGEIGWTWSFEAWIKPQPVCNSNLADWGYVQTGIITGDNHWDPYMGLRQYDEDNDNVTERAVMQLYLQNQCPSMGIVPYNGWSHLVGTFEMTDVNTTKFSFYIDGSLVGTRTVTDNALNDSAGIGSFKMGDNNAWRGAYFNGTIDEVHVYNRALSKGAVEALSRGRREVDITVRNIGSEEIPKATWVANLKQDGTTVETDAYNASAIDTGELSTLKFYFKNFKPNTEYTIELQGTGTSTTVSC